MVSLSIETSCKFLAFVRSRKFGGDVYKSPNLVSPCWRNIPSRTLLFTNVYAKASVTRRAIVSPSLTTNLEIAIVLIGVVFSYASRYLGATSTRRRTAGLEGIDWEAAFIALA
jgi:hypothetical protein